MKYILFVDMRKRCLIHLIAFSNLFQWYMSASNNIIIIFDLIRDFHDTCGHFIWTIHMAENTKKQIIKIQLTEDMITWLSSNDSVA